MKHPARPTIKRDATGHYVVALHGRQLCRTLDLIEAVSIADPDGDGVVNCDLETECALRSYTGEPATVPRLPDDLGAFFTEPPPCHSHAKRSA